MTNRQPPLLEWTQVRHNDDHGGAWEARPDVGRTYYATGALDARYPADSAELTWVLIGRSLVKSSLDRVTVRQTHRDFAGCQNAAAHLEAEATWWTP